MWRMDWEVGTGALLSKGPGERTFAKGDSRQAQPNWLLPVRKPRRAGFIPCLHAA